MKMLLSDEGHPGVFSMNVQFGPGEKHDLHKAGLGLLAVAQAVIQNLKVEETVVEVVEKVPPGTNGKGGILRLPGSERRIERSGERRRTALARRC